jgi:hypothetical protein
MSGGHELRIEGMSCPYCQGVLTSLSYGGCGGQGSLYGCENCDAVFRQETGGLAPTPDGDRYSQASYTLRQYNEFYGPKLMKEKKKTLKNKKT